MSRRRTMLIASLALAAASLAVRPRASRSDDVEPISPRVATSVDLGLAWLAKTQGGDGSWESRGAGAGVSAAATGLAAMAFMARGHVPGEGPYGNNLNNAIDAILKKQQPDGVFADRMQGQVMYDHGICTMALCEAYGMLDDGRQAKARTAISLAVRVILDAQRIPKSTMDQGGWRYTPTSHDSDTSVSGWQLLALRGARNIGADLPKDAIDQGITFIKHHAVFGGGFGYVSNSSPNAAMTATGILALSLLGEPDAGEVAAGGDLLLRIYPESATRGEHYYYTAYYCSQAAWQLGGNYWTTIHNAMTQGSGNLIDRQEHDGHWPGNEGGDVVCTSMAILALTVPYRYLPIYQR